ncbi:serine protease inhibitor I/II-like [Scylla paramamosain]|uniref:serine protease inhibitor I/II-like n=1 Tax=Scylla paramamosain TaxID=85552 RepID=UPI00308392E8
MKAQVAVVVVVVVAAAVFMHVQATCKEGMTGYNGCNSCTCFNTMVICTRRQCGPHKSDKCRGMLGSSWMDNCHKCTCVNGTSSCVLMPDCVTGKVKYPQCEGDTSFLYECNRCRCVHNATHPACTMMACPSQFENMVTF